jgi:hypothetical protein
VGEHGGGIWLIQSLYLSLYREIQTSDTDTEQDDFVSVSGHPPQLREPPSLSAISDNSPFTRRYTSMTKSSHLM